MSEPWEDDESNPMLPPEDSIALNPAPKIGSELHISSHSRSSKKKRKGKKNPKRVAFQESPQIQHSIIRELLEHPATSEEDENQPETEKSDLRNEIDDFEDLIGENLTGSELGNQQQPRANETVDPEVYKAKVKSLSEWNNITNMDQFLELCYDYYIYRGRGALVLHDISTLAKLAFMLVFASILAYAVDWSFINKPASTSSHPKLWEVVSVANFFRQLTIFGIICITVFGGYWWIQFMRFWNRLPLYDQVSRFYLYLLEIKDKDFGDTIDFADICDAIMKLHDKNKIVEDSLDARDICNRIMRRDNYLIALFNRDLLNLNDGLPSLLGNNALLLTRILEWNISFCLIRFRG